MKKLALVARMALLVSVLFVCASCARFPTGTSAVGYTRLSFSWTLNGSADPNCFYIVAIRVVDPPVGTSPALAQTVGGPSPVIAGGSLNGIVGGLPTHYVIWNSTLGYEVYRFPLQNSGSEPINLTMPGIDVGPVLPGTAIDPTPSDPTQPYGNQMGFTIDTSYLAQSLVGNGGPQSIQIIQFNILTTNALAKTINPVSGRFLDAIGDQSEEDSPTFNDPIQVNITSGNTYKAGQGNLPPENAGDNYPNSQGPASIDMTGWQLTVTAPTD